MKKINILILGILLAVIGVGFAFAQSQDGWLNRCVGSIVATMQEDGVQVQCVVSDLYAVMVIDDEGETHAFLPKTPTPTETSFSEPTSTPIEEPTDDPDPTEEPEPTVTPTEEPDPTDEPTQEPTAEPTSAPVSGAPYPGAPLCPTHNDTEFHELWDSERGCHYDHAHGMELANWAYSLFGSEATQIGQTISYPWQTPHENELKHKGYVVYAFQDSPCVLVRVHGGITNWAVQFHGVGISIGKLARFHSFYGAASLCNSDGDAGQIISGGHSDYGMLHSPYKKEFVSYPRFPDQLYEIGPPPYIGENPPFPGTSSSANQEVWNNNTRGTTRAFVDEHKLFSFAFRIRRPVDFVDPNTRSSGNPVFIPHGYPDSNSSAYQLYQLEIFIPDLNGDGSPVDFKGYTDLHGNIDSGCVVASSSCVPLTLRGAMPGSYQVNLTSLGVLDNQDPNSYFDHDIYFNGQPSGWIDLSDFGQ